MCSLLAGQLIVPAKISLTKKKGQILFVCVCFDLPERPLLRFLRQTAGIRSNIQTTTLPAPTNQPLECEEDPTALQGQDSEASPITNKNEKNKLAKQENPIRLSIRKTKSVVLRKYNQTDKPPYKLDQKKQRANLYSRARADGLVGALVSRLARLLVDETHRRETKVGKLAVAVGTNQHVVGL
jgi:hypothetical protein